MIPVTLILVYLCLLLGLGFLSSRLFRGNTSDYFVASRSIGPIVLFMSVFGTTMTAFAMVGSTAEAYRVGIGTFGKIASWSALIHSGCFFLIGLPLWRLGKTQGYVTQIEFFRDRFESKGIGYLLFPVLVGLIIPYLLVGLMGAGSVVKGVTMGAFPDVFPSTNGGVPPALTSGIISCVVLYYIFAGGVRSAAWANTFQTCVFMVMGLLAFVMIANKLGGLKAAAAMADTAKGMRAGNITELQFLSYCFIPLSVGMFPHLFQNCLTAKSSNSFKLTLVAHPLCIMLTWIPCILIGFWATGALMPDGIARVIPEAASPNAVLGIMVGKLTTPIIAGLVSAGVLAAIMSSLDSQFVAVGTMFTRDIVVDRFGQNRFSEKQMLWMARGFIVTIVVVTYLLTLAEPRQIFSLGIWCFSGFAGLFPLVFAAIYWKRATKVGAYAAIIAGAVTWFSLFSASGYGANKGFLVLGVMPVVFIFLACAAGMLIGSLVSQPPAEATLNKFFKNPKA